MKAGIVTLANDTMSDQLVAFLNSVEDHAGADVPVCVIPYDHRIDAVARAVRGRRAVFLHDDAAALGRWEEFVTAAWRTCPAAWSAWGERGIEGVHRLAMHRRLAAFDGPFDRFVYFDADTLVLAPVDAFFAALDDYDFAVYDDQYKAPRHVFALDSSRLPAVFAESRVGEEVFCSGVFAARRDLFPAAARAQLLAALRGGEGEILYPFAPVNALLNYMVLRRELRSYNFFRALPANERALTCVTARNLVERDNLLFDGSTRLPFLHYIGVPAEAFQRLCAGENMDIRYRESFLHYRFEREPQSRPRLRGPRQPFHPRPGHLRRLLDRLRGRR